MRAYVITTGIVFALLVVAHVWRMLAESPRLATDPFFLAITVAAAALATWAAWVLRQAKRP
jgi:hypothetical protein